ncbi:Putative S-adenosyl-L-methionine-dependent methyltransferase, Methyltransferase domain 25 [Septoria linicola]|uniref:S-adenosyl-L-methionine-dependent methyltransferase, Methyltransferase domain 25 n=1 Tax=Septoria linicola TaxID=215465 RepID=A0A9Q9ADD7_9PEZI|nr:putative S-adenosyl-L-methionine-dependent methyltransferase, Methyltransferase domain 25 [Septoria linicola]USW47479.1 Putative S-adenosyl-L-methionine-dependent methyltransferase, Methyltransferase domain 25 [Septoria linicola]
MATYSMEEAVVTLQPLMSGESTFTNASQLRHRLRILDTWFGEQFSALSGATVLELGCGQGDMTVPLAYYAKKVLAVDPASLSYGSPMTLGQAQKRLSESKEVGVKIQWIQQDSIEYIESALGADVDYVVLAHSIWYLESEEYLARLLGALHKAVASVRAGKETKLLIAEWGLRYSDPAAEPHVLAAKAQATNPKAGGNVCNILTPARIQSLAESVGWALDGETWIESPDVEDGQWEVELTRTLALEEKVIDRDQADFLELERAVEDLCGAKVGSMDVWTGTFRISQ